MDHVTPARPPSASAGPLPGFNVQATPLGPIVRLQSSPQDSGQGVRRKLRLLVQSALQHFAAQMIVTTYHRSKLRVGFDLEDPKNPAEDKAAGRRDPNDAFPSVNRLKRQMEKEIEASCRFRAASCRGRQRLLVMARN